MDRRFEGQSRDGVRGSDRARVLGRAAPRAGGRAICRCSTSTRRARTSAGADRRGGAVGRDFRDRRRRRAGASGQLERRRHAVAVRADRRPNNNAGIEGGQNPLGEYETEALDRVLAINVKGVFFGMKHTLPHLKAQGSGAIVNAASVGGIRAVPNLVAYVAAKHAVAGMTKSGATEYGEFGVRVNAIAPGAIMTEMIQDVAQADRRRGRLGNRGTRVRQRQSDAAFRSTRGGRQGRRLPAVRRRVVRQRRRADDRRRAVAGLLTGVGLRAGTTPARSLSQPRLRRRRARSRPSG